LTSPRVARRSTVELRPVGGLQARPWIGPDGGRFPSPVGQRGLISRGRRVGSSCIDCRAGGLLADALGGR
jgi:hypothetical protein